MAAPTGEGGGQFPVFAPRAAGGLWVAWFEGDALRLAAYTPGGADGPWSEPETIVQGESLVVNWADTPALFETATGTVVVAFPQRHLQDHGAEGHETGTGTETGTETETETHGEKHTAAEGYGMSIVARAADGTIGTPWAPDDIRKGPESGFAGLIANGDGARLYWLDGRALGTERGRMHLATVVIGADGQQGAPARILDHSVCECCKLGVGTFGLRSFAAYRGRSDEEVRDIRVSGPGMPPKSVADDGWTISGCPVNGPAVASGPTAKAWIAWFTGADGKSRNLLTIGTTQGFEPPTRFDLGSPAGRVDLLALDDGDALVSWVELDPDQPGQASLLSRRISPAGDLGEPVVIAPVGAGRDWGFPKTAQVGSDVVWAYTDPSGDAPAVKLHVGPPAP